MIESLICFFQGHLKFYYVAHTDYPKDEDPYWCGRCGHESSEAADEQERVAREIAMYNLTSPYSRRYA